MATPQYIASIRIPQLPVEPVDKKAQLQARKRVNYAVLKGVLPRVSTQPCVVCRDTSHVYHHESYARDAWLIVLPMCNACHKLLHAVPRDEFITRRVVKIRQIITWLKNTRNKAPLSRRASYDESISTHNARIQHLMNSEVL